MVQVGIGEVTLSGHGEQDQKLFILGLDGATLDLIEPWGAAGRLPNLTRLMAQGVYGELRSTIHPLTPQAWSTMFTGKNAGKHGIYDFFQISDGSYDLEFTNASHIRTRTLWSLLSAYGKRIAVVGVPFTYPPEPVSGVMIAGFEAPRADHTLTYPPQLFNEIVAATGKYRLHEGIPIGKKLDDYYHHLQLEINNRLDVIRYLWARGDWDFFMAVFHATDFVQHFFWHFMDPDHPLYDPAQARKYGDCILRVYQDIDRVVGEVDDLLDDQTNLVIVSDHGAGSLKKVINLNRWLYDMDLMAINEAGYSPREKMLIKARDLMKRHLPRATKDWLKQRVPRVRSSFEALRQTTDIKWSETRAFSSGIFGNIYINTVGRYPEGTVRPGGEYDSLCRRIIRELENLRDPDTGAEIVERVYRREELYSGPLVNKAPDLVIKWVDYEYYTSQDFRGGDDLFIPAMVQEGSDFVQSGTHRLNGTFITKGPLWKQGHHLVGARIEDITPTVLYTLGLPVPSDIDGQVLVDGLLTEYVANVPIRTSVEDGVVERADVGYSEQDALAVRERLRGLGYLE